MSALPTRRTNFSPFASTKDRREYGFIPMSCRTFLGMKVRSHQSQRENQHYYNVANPQDSRCEPLRELYSSAFPLLVSSGAKRTMTLAFRVRPWHYFNFHPK